MRMPLDIMPARVQRRRWTRPLTLTERRSRPMKNGKWSATNDRTRSKKLIRMHQRQPSVSLDKRSLRIRKLAEFIHTSLSEPMTHELKPTFSQHASEESSPGGSSAYTEGRGRISYRSKWNSTLNKNQWNSKSSTI